MIQRCLLTYTLAAALAAYACAQSKAPDLASFPGTSPALTLNAVPIGPLAPDYPLHLTIGLVVPHQKELEAFVNSVSDPSSNSYRHFISPDVVGSRFGLSQAEIQEVRNYFASKGFVVAGQAKTRMTLSIVGTVAQVQNALHTSMLQYSAADGYKPKSRPLFSYSGSISLPSAILNRIRSINGIESFTHPRPRYETPDQIRQLYSIAPMYGGGKHGQGRTIAFTNFDGLRVSNLNDFYSAYNLPIPYRGIGENVAIIHCGSNASDGDQYGEGDLDLQAICAVAPLADINIYDGNEDLTPVLSREADDNLADVISDSWGWQFSDSTAETAHSLLLAMSAEGITYMAASGDDGTDLSYYYPNIDPEVLNVGGTSVSTDSLGNRASEIAWSGSGSGWSTRSVTFNVLPSYLKGNGVPTNIPYRLLPDVSLDADPDSGYMVNFNGDFEIFGGTSGASPTMAAGLGIASETLIDNNILKPDQNNNYRFGRIQDLIYALNGDSNVFFDIVSGTAIGSLPDGTNASAHTGWDFVTGWGSMNFNGFVSELSNLSVTGLTVTPTIQGGGIGSGTVTLAHNAPSSGLYVRLTGGDTSIFYPSTVYVASGANQATFAYSTSSVTSTHSETLKATIGIRSTTAAITIYPGNTLSSVALSPAAVTSGQSSAGTVTLSAPAGGGGVLVSLTTSNTGLAQTSSTSITIPQGSSTGTFGITTVAKTVTYTVQVKATVGSTTVSQPLTAYGDAITGLSISPASVIGGTATTGTVTLKAAAPAGGWTVNLLSHNTGFVGVPSSVTVPAGSTTGTFNVTTKAYTGNYSTSISASDAASAASVNITVYGNHLVSLAFNPSSIYGGGSSTGTVTISGAAPPGGWQVNLKSSNSAFVSVPASVTVPEGATTVTFQAQAKFYPKSYSVNFTASDLVSSKPATLTVYPIVINSLVLTPSSVQGGQNSMGSVTLSQPAPSSGWVVTLKSSNSAFVSVSATVTVPAGATSVSFTITTVAHGSTYTSGIKASDANSSQSATLTVTH